MYKVLALSYSAAVATMVLGACITSPARAMRSTQILFVCDHGNVKSVMAASYFNQAAKERGLPFKAVSRGVTLDSDVVPPKIAAALLADGFDVSAFHPTTVADTDVTASRRVVTIVTELPASARVPGVVTERWNDVPPASVDYAASRAALKSRIVMLLESLRDLDSN